MTKLYSYILRVDDGAAPNPFWGTCTLAIGRPGIRRIAEKGDWIIGTGSKYSYKNSKADMGFSDSLIFAIKVTDKMTIREYDLFCQKSLSAKIPDCDSDDFKRRVGDCIYDFSNAESPTIRRGVRSIANMESDLRGQYCLLSKEFCYFGENPILLPEALKILICKSQGHKKISEKNLINSFEEWISEFMRATIYAKPKIKIEDFEN